MALQIMEQIAMVLSGCVCVCVCVADMSDLGWHIKKYGPRKENRQCSGAGERTLGIGI